MLDHLKNINTEVLDTFLKSRDASVCGIPQPLADYILQVSEASDTFKGSKSISDCARKLQKNYPSLSISTCRSRVYDAINFFNSDCTVTTEAWNLYFADEMMKLFRVNLAAHDFKEARVCFERAREYRISASATAVNGDRIRFKPQIVSSDMELDRMGIKRQGILDAHRKALSIIRSRDIPSEDKARLEREIARELNIEDIDTNESQEIQ